MIGIIIMPCCRSLSAFYDRSVITASATRNRSKTCAVIAGLVPATAMTRRGTVQAQMSIDATLRLDADRPQQEGGKMPQIRRRFVARALWRVRGAPRSPVADGGNLFLPPGGGGTLMGTQGWGRTPVMAPTMGRRFPFISHGAAGPWYGLADELFY